MADEFTVVSSSKRANRKKNKLVYKEKAAQDYVELLEHRRLELEGSRFFAELKSTLDGIFHPTESSRLAARPIEYIRCLALGQPSSSLDKLNAIYQLALLQLLLDYFGLKPSQASVWDPVFDNMDKEIFGKLGIEVSKDDPETTIGKESWLYYLPHAPQSLVDATLGEIEKFPQALILGNYIPTYDRELGVADIKEKYPYIKEFLEDIDKPTDEAAWSLTEIADSHSRKDAWFTAVNDMAVHYRRDKSA